VGREARKPSSAPIFKPYQVNNQLVQRTVAKTTCAVCLTGDREIPDEVMDGPNSIVSLMRLRTGCTYKKALLALLI